VTWAEHALTRLRDAGYRQGGARRAVVELLGAQPCAVSARTILDTLRESGRSVGQASVYRTLEQLAELGLVHRLEMGRGNALYERVAPDGEHHHHFVCADCGTVEPFADPGLERAIAEVERLQAQRGVRVDDHEVVLHGHCGCEEP